MERHGGRQCARERGRQEEKRVRERKQWGERQDDIEQRGGGIECSVLACGN